MHGHDTRQTRDLAAWEAVLDALPGVRYEREPVYGPLSSTVGEGLADIGIGLPMATIGRVKPTNPVTWLIRNAILTTAIFAWVFTVGWILLFIGLILIPIEESWSSMRSR